MSPAAKRKRPPDRRLLMITGALVGIGWLVLYSASALVAEGRFGDQYYFLNGRFFGPPWGPRRCWSRDHLPRPGIQKMARPLLLLTAVLLVMVLVPGDEVDGRQALAPFRRVWVSAVGTGETGPDLGPGRLFGPASKPTGSIFERVRPRPRAYGHGGRLDCLGTGFGDAVADRVRGRGDELVGPVRPI